MILPFFSQFKAWLAEVGKRLLLWSRRGSETDPDNHLPNLTRHLSKELSHPIAHGSFGDVWKCIYVGFDRLEVAVKSIRIDIALDDSKDRITQILLRDYRARKQLQHENLLPLLGFSYEFGPLPAMVSPWTQNGSLTTYLNKNFTELTIERKFQILQQVAAAISYLHSKDVIHGDLTTNNILIDFTCTAHVADHGILAMCSELAGTSYIRSNVRWAAPELFEVPENEDSLPAPNPASDIYSFGCIMLQVMTGRLPYADARSDHQVTDLILSLLPRFHVLQCKASLVPRPLQQPHDAESDSQPPVAPEAMLQDLTKFITKIGEYPVARGGFSEIWKCIYKTDLGSTKVAVKSLLVYASDEDGEEMKKKSKRIRRELKICAGVRHSNILPVLGHTSGFGPFVAIVSPWAENGNLTTYLEREDANVHVVRRFHMLRDIAAGLQHLHSHYIIHGDLTGLNVLIHGDGSACIADFGLSLMYSEVVGVTQASWTSTIHGNLRWLAPELLGESEDDVPVRPRKWSDIYSFGNIMLNVLTSKVPYYYIIPAAASQYIGAGKKPDRSRYRTFSDDYWHFIEECWSDAPGDRPSIERVVEVIKDELESLSSSSAA